MKKNEICDRLDRIDLNLELHMKRTDLLEDWVKKTNVVNRWMIGVAVTWITFLTGYIITSMQ